MVPIAVTVIEIKYPRTMAVESTKRYRYAFKLNFWGKNEYPSRIRVASSVNDDTISSKNGSRQNKVIKIMMQWAKN